LHSEYIVLVLFNEAILPYFNYKQKIANAIFRMGDKAVDTLSRHFNLLCTELTTRLTIPNANYKRKLAM
jgi:hypothetical protein